MITVFTNGVFDILHPGHVRYLQAARALGHGDSYELVHAREAQRLRLRERHRQQYVPGSEIRIPFGPDEELPYSWSTLDTPARARARG